MYDIKTRVELVKNGVRRLRRSREKNLLRAFFRSETVRTFYGTILLHEDAGGYVLVGLVAFSAAVVITTLCFKYREHERRKDWNEKKE